VTERTLKIVLAYDGTALVGWQRQAEGTSVQGILEDALATIEGRPVGVVGAGRTDAGVHALGQVASCRLRHPIPVDALRRALNAMLPADVRVGRVEEAPDDFHARYSARAKTYRYVVLTGEFASPFERRYVWHVPQPLDVASMARAARSLEGERDFAALQGAGSASRTTVRAVTRVHVAEAGSVEMFGTVLTLDDREDRARLVVVEMTGGGFLRHMVRNAVGSLVEVAAGRRDAGWLEGVLASRDRTRAGATAPASGLFLVSVAY
jgi:tRNA pseudouridine38-40 synthase